MNLGLVLLETSQGPHPIVFGIIALAVLLIALTWVRMIGKNRPHS